jgi:hypothetical protein
MEFGLEQVFTMKINATTGELIVGQQALGPNIKETDFLTSELGAGAKQIPYGDKKYYEVWRQITPKLEIGLTLGFSPHGPLQRISVQCVKPGTRRYEWSKALEDEIKHYHDEWLKEQLGEPPYHFAWGRIMSIIEPHWYSANIVIDYMAGFSG